jgi:prepilin-type N-terminal cleavage/methylation domain-containing protein
MNNFAKNSHKKIPISKQAGFSMLEVLIALVIILFGILGAEGVQLSAINNANIAKQKSLAAMVATAVLQLVVQRQPMLVAVFVHLQILLGTTETY